MNEAESVYVFKPLETFCPLVISLPHAGSFLPKDFIKSSALDEKQLHLSEDSFTDQLFGNEEFNIPFIKALYSRAYIDVNREPLELTKKMFKDELPPFANHFSAIAAKGFGTIPEKIKAGLKIYKYKLSYDDAKGRIEKIYNPFHKNLAELIKETCDKFDHCVLLDGHSMPFRRWRKNYDVVISNNFGTTSEIKYTEILGNLFKKQGFSVNFNKPFSGGYIVRHYGCPELDVSAVQIEVLKSLYMDENTLMKTKDFSLIQGKIQAVIKEFANLIK